MKIYFTLPIALSALCLSGTSQARSEFSSTSTNSFQSSRSDDVQISVFQANASYATCFTPGQDCEGLIVREIARARSRILMQAYFFTSVPIAKALVAAKKKGVEVHAIVDKSQRSEKYTGSTFLKNNGIPVVVDEKPTIAHSKIFIVDNDTVITGSFNFTKAAQDKNAENLILLKGDFNLVRRYVENWQRRWKESVVY